MLFAFLASVILINLIGISLFLGIIVFVIFTGDTADQVFKRLELLDKFCRSIPRCLMPRSKK